MSYACWKFGFVKPSEDKRIRAYSHTSSFRGQTKMISLQSWVLICLVSIAAMKIKDSDASMPATLPTQTVTSGSTVEIKVTDDAGTKYRWCVFGIWNADDINPNPWLSDVNNYKGENEVEVIPGTAYDGRVSFFGDLNVGKAWFRITDVKEEDSNRYKMRCNSNQGKFYHPVMELKVLPAEKEWEPLGCYEDSSDRALSFYHGKIKFDDSPGGFKRMFEECKKKQRKKGLNTLEYSTRQNAGHRQKMKK
ncbi:uncharacterized protein LOC116287822 isoform X2 [Actinia tenebrosa]|uniref:Uncharacterized protein LOC116287822 isoform X2 n=1 Tax=Actinia tenebrosa TaxID=6105 RepID=A0A6P8HCX2_ACTTE|nr:uncharacterized protein LOC116287822 isoform X2 [Actinia tenebrosa]